MDYSIINSLSPEGYYSNNKKYFVSSNPTNQSLFWNNIYKNNIHIIVCLLSSKDNFPIYFNLTHINNISIKLISQINSSQLCNIKLHHIPKYQIRLFRINDSYYVYHIWYTNWLNSTLPYYRNGYEPDPLQDLNIYDPTKQYNLMNVEDIYIINCIINKILLNNSTFSNLIWVHCLKGQCRSGAFVVISEFTNYLLLNQLKYKNMLINKNNYSCDNKDLTYLMSLYIAECRKIRYNFVEKQMFNIDLNANYHLYDINKLIYYIYYSFIILIR